MKIYEGAIELYQKCSKLGPGLSLLEFDLSTLKTET